MKRLQLFNSCLFILLLLTSLKAHSQGESEILLPSLLSSAPAYLQRNSPQAQLELAKVFFAQLNDSKPEIVAARKLLEVGKPTAAMDAFRTYFLNKLRKTPNNFWENNEHYDKNITPGKMDTLAKTKADAALQGLLYTNNDKKKPPYKIGEPGSVNWGWGFDFYGDRKMKVNLFLKENLSPLIQAYIGTSELKYLDRWNAYYTDLLIYLQTHTDPRPSFDHSYISDNFTFPDAIRELQYLSIVSKMESDNSKIIESEQLVRFLTQLVRIDGVRSAEYLRGNPQNHALIRMSALFMAGVYFDEFTCGKWLANEGLRGAEQYAENLNRKDGSEHQRDPHYNHTFLGWGVGTIKNLCYDSIYGKRAHELVGDEWLLFAKDRIIERSRWLVRIIDPIGRLPMGARGDNRNRANIFKPIIENTCPEALKLSDVAVHLNRVINYAKNPSTPAYTSDAFAYGGFSLMRDSWSPQGQQGTFYCVDGETDGFRINANNYFGVAAFGRTMLDPCEPGFYNQVLTPVLADGQEQNGNAGVLRMGGHFRAYLGDPIPVRNLWLSTKNFDVTDGVYNRYWGGGSWGTPENVANGLEHAFQGTKHRRIVQFVKAAGLWVVTDCMDSDVPRTMTVRWILPMDKKLDGTNKNYIVFGNQDIKISKDSNILFTTQPNVPNFSLHYVTSFSLDFQTKTEGIGKTSGYFYVDAISPKLASSKLVQSVIYPRDKDAADISEFKNIKSADGTFTGFSTTTPTGWEVQQIVTEKKQGRLTLGNLTANAYSLLTASKNKTEINGVVIGCSEFIINKEKIKVNFEDFEFTIINGKVTNITPIYRPISDVLVAPDATVFSDKLDLKFICTTPEVDIRYTNDNTDPTLQSPLFTGKLTIDKTTLIKARAFRRGLKEMPVDMSGTLAGFSTRAVFTKQDMLPAQNVKVTKTGLNYAYYEAIHWEYLYKELHLLKPLKTGETTLLDISNRLSEGPFAFKYSGYIDVPADGVYAFYWPDEYNRQDYATGYELVVRIDGKESRVEQRHHGRGTWSITLQKGLHHFETDYADIRGTGGSVDFVDMSMNFKFDRSGKVTGKERNNFYPQYPFLRDYVWSGIVPELKVLAPGMLQPQAISASWLKH